MNKLTAFAVAATLAFAAPAFAADASDVAKDAQNVQADQAAVAKDNAVISKHRAHINEQRAAKAKAKAEGDLGTQATESVKLGAEHVTVGAKKAERSIDENIQEHDTQTMKDDANAVAK